MTQVENLIDLFKKSGLTETESIELDNLDMAMLKYNDDKEVVVENEYGTEFPVSDLSREEMEIFLLVIPCINPEDALRARLISCMNKYNEVIAERDALLTEATEFIKKGETQKKSNERHNKIFDFEGSMLFRMTNTHIG